MAREARLSEFLVTLRGAPAPLDPDRVPGLAGALERAAAAIARLDQALAFHPLLPAFLHRARLAAVRRQAGVDGLAIDPWHLAAILEGLRPRLDLSLRIIDRGMIFEAARHALHLHQWLVTPDAEQEPAIRQAAAALAQARTPLLAAAHGAHAWLEGGGGWPPLRVALIRHWMQHRLLGAPVPLTGAAALRPGTPWEPDAWIPAFLTALADEADDGLHLLADLERAWVAARAVVAGRRRHSRAGAAVDLLAAAPLLSATSLAAGIGMAVNNAAALLDGFCAAGIVVEVTHRAKRRLFGLTGMAPLADAVAPPRRPLPGRGRGRPPNLPIAAAEAPAPPALPPLSPLARRVVDYSGLDAAMAHAEQAIRNATRTLDALAAGTLPASDSPSSATVPSAARESEGDGVLAARAKGSLDRPAPGASDDGADDVS